MQHMLSDLKHVKWFKPVNKVVNNDTHIGVRYLLGVFSLSP